MTNLTAVSAASFVNTIGVNTHIDFNAYGYENLATVENALEYLGVKNVRDSGQNNADLTTWLQVAQATGVRFDDYIGENSPAGMSADLALTQQLAQEGILNYVEGGNEEDDTYPASLGNTLAVTAQFQQQVYAVAQQLGLPTINMSFGAGWTPANDWHGNYDKVGDLSAVTNYGNGHAYPNPGQTPASAIQQINGDAVLAASSRPVIITEMGWDNNTFSQAAEAQYVVQATLDGMKYGDVKTYFYALFDDGSGAFGLMNPDGSAKPAGTALHNLTGLLSDTGSNPNSFAPSSLSFTLSGAQDTDNTLLMQKSDGSDWLALWDESAGNHTVTVYLGATASQISVFDPVAGTSAIVSASGTGSISVNLGNDPLLIEVVPAGGLAQGVAGSGAASSGAAAASSGSASDVGIAAFDSTQGQTTTPAIAPYSGPVAGLAHESINITSHSLNVAVSTPNWFIYTGGSYDAITVCSGTNVVEGGTGSNFLTGGSGNDTFYVDDRTPAADIWSTVNNFHAGDAATVWGVTPQDFNLDWENGQGAPGYTGLTLHVTKPDAPTASLTLTGYSTADLSNGHLSVQFGNVEGANYMYLKAY